MTSNTDFPSNLLTNAYVLHDFAEIAYIVCTGAIPASANSSNTTTDVNSSEQILARLRLAETQFRKASILVALDADKLELFTFYKKVDVVKDQRTILSKFGYVCRLNSCIIAQKSAARVIDLLKPESTRVYRLFTSAILSSIRIAPRNNDDAVKIGDKRYLLPCSSRYRDLECFHDTSRLWTLHQVDIQIITSGQVILTVYQTSPTPLFLLSDVFTSEDQSPGVVPGNTVLYLAPMGQLARLKAGWRGTAASLNRMARPLKEIDHNMDKWRRIWLAKATTWMNASASLEEVISDATIWIETEIPVWEKTSTGSKAPSSIIWKTIWWPVHLVYAFSSPDHDWTDARHPTSETSPTKSAEEWYLNTAARESSMARMNDQGAKIGDPEDGEHLFEDELHFGGTTQFAPFTASSFPPSQMVYPTPPDVAMTHHTPGLLSADGLAPTPVAPQMSQEKEAYSSDSEMPDIEKSPVSNRNGNSALAQDEDLFEELPGQTFGEGGLGDDPNWDFFDEPGFELGTASEVNNAPVVRSPLQADDAVMKDSSERRASAGNDNPSSEPSHASTGKEKPSAQVSPNSATVTNETQTEELIDTQEFKFKEDTDSSAQAVEQENRSNIQGTISHAEPEPEQPQRRMSLYERLGSRTQREDTKYGAEGKYWFDMGLASMAHDHSSAYPSTLPRPQSPSSDASKSSTSQDDSGDEDDGEIKSKTNGHHWTAYQVKPLVEEIDQESDFKEAEAILDAEQLLSIIEKNTDESLTPYVVQPLRTSETRSRVFDQHISMLAQIVAEQASQSSLLDMGSCMNMEKQGQSLQFELSMDNAGSNTVLSCASLAELTAIQPASAQTKPASKVAALKYFKVRIGRFDGEIAAGPSIIRYWDTLNLHPLNGRKDLKAFVVHPRGDNYSEGCNNFLQRLGLCYSNLNLGVHDVGAIEGVTDHGLLPWNPSEYQANLQQVCQHLGTALATSEAQNQTIVMYMVLPDDDPSSCLDLCDGFITLFESFLKARQSSGGELALQLIPRSFVVDANTLAVPPEDQYRTLAIEVYNRLPPSIAERQPVSSGSAILLANQPAANLSFELNGKESSPFSREGDCLHLAFAYSADKRWLTATWTDQLGESALSMSYCLQMSPQSSKRPRIDIFRDLCEISGQMMVRRRKKWWLAVAKAGFYEREEIREWLYLATEMTGDHKSLGRVVLVSVQLRPRISLQQSEVLMKVASNHTHQAGNSLGTPVSTPQASMTSPDHVIPATPASGGNPSTAAQTPPEQAIDNFADTEITLVDPSEETWMATLPFGLNQSHNFFDIWPALASGFLIKRAADVNNEANNLVLLGINLVATPRVPSLSHADRENLLQDLMMQYRGLVTLAASRGCIDSRKQCVPWHIAAVVKAAKVLGEIV